MPDGVLAGLLALTIELGIAGMAILLVKHEENKVIRNRKK
jgi:hypothetical protein